MGKRIEDLRVAERGRIVFPKTKAKRDLLPPGTVCRKYEEAGSSLLDPKSIPCYKNLLFHIFSEGLADIFCCCRSMKCGSREGDEGISEKYIDGDIIGRHGILKNALLLLIPVF